MAALYEPVPPPRVVVMLLVDNNRFTQLAWSDLRDHCLPPLFERLSSVYPSTMIMTFVQETCPSHHEILPPSREYYGFQEAIQDVRFEGTSSNKLTVPRILGAIQFLSSIVALARHIIIIGSNPVYSPDSSGSWQHLAQSLATGSIFCHLMLHANSAGPKEPLNLMFDEALRLQNLTEDNRWLSNDRSKIIPRLSAVQRSDPQVTPLEASPSTIQPRVELPSGQFERNNYPVPAPAMHSSAPASPSDPEEGLSLVTQLQQIHGLTKKKVYGTKPKRKSFVSTEVYREHPRRASSLSPVLPDTNHGGRVTSTPSQLSRAARVYQSHSTFPPPGVSRPYIEPHSAPPSTSSYLPPTILTPASPPSPVLNHAPPSWNPSVSSLPSSYQPPHSIPSNPSSEFRHDLRSESNPLAETTTNIIKNGPLIDLEVDGQQQPIIRNDGGVHFLSSSAPINDRLHHPPVQTPLYQNQDRDISINDFAPSSTIPSYRRIHIPPSIYRDELLSHLERPSPAPASGHLAMVGGASLLSINTTIPKPSEQHHQFPNIHPTQLAASPQAVVSNEGNADINPIPGSASSAGALNTYYAQGDRIYHDTYHIEPGSPPAAGSYSPPSHPPTIQAPPALWHDDTPPLVPAYQGPSYPSTSAPLYNSPGSISSPSSSSSSHQVQTSSASQPHHYEVTASVEEGGRDWGRYSASPPALADSSYNVPSYPHSYPSSYPPSPPSPISSSTSSLTGWAG